jgi:hypothetical protein
MWSVGFRSTSLSSFHRANSFIHIFFFFANRQRRFGGIARTAVKLPAESRITLARDDDLRLQTQPEYFSSLLAFAINWYFIF